MGLARSAYSLALWAAQPLLLRKLRRRGQAEPGYLEAVDERFGRYRSPAHAGALWIHAVSLGETRAAAILVRALREQAPALRFVFTHGTATGRAEGLRLMQPGDQQAWLPWDTPGAVARFLDHFRPCAGVLLETEVWPNLVDACARRSLPLVLANARLSEKSLRQTLRLSPLAYPAFASLRAVWAQTESDAQRLARVGARVSGVLGNLKFDAQPDAALLAQGRAWRAASQRPVLAFASSREGEEAGFFEAVRDRMHAAQGPRPQWLVVPRHPQRFDEVTRCAQQAGLSVSRRSAWGGMPEPADVWIGDSLGEMALYYGLSDVALLGGSFAPLGGQNLIEAAACGCPVVMGPHTFNFAEAGDKALAAGAALRVGGLPQAVDEALALVADSGRRASMVASALAFTEAHRGAAGRTAQAVLALCGDAFREPAGR